MYSYNQDHYKICSHSWSFDVHYITNEECQVAIYENSEAVEEKTWNRMAEIISNNSSSYHSSAKLINAMLLVMFVGTDINV